MMFALRLSTTLAALKSSYVAAAAPVVLNRAFHSSPAHRSTIADMVEKVHTTERLGELRKLMKEHKIDVYSTALPQCLLTYLDILIGDSGAL